MTEFENSEYYIPATDCLDAIEEMDESIFERNEQLDARRTVENMLEEQALKKLLDDESYYDFR